MSAACSDQDFIDSWQRNQSGIKVSKELGVSYTQTLARRRRIEKRYNIQLGVRDHRPTYNSAPYIHEHNARISLTIKDAVLPVASDVHVWPGQKTTAQRAYIEFVKRLKPRYVIMNGDVFDGSRISRHPRIGFLEKRPLVRDELRAVSEFLTAVEEAAPRGATFIWTLGNHDARYESYIAQAAPEMEGVHGMHLKDWFPKWEPCWSVHINEGTEGYTVIKHRWHNGIHSNYNNALRSGTNFVAGHLHKLDSTKWVDYRGHRYGVDTGFMSDRDDAQFVHYTEDNPKNWTSGFVVLSFKDGKLMRPEFVQKWDEDRVEFRGEVVKV